MKHTTQYMFDQPRSHYEPELSILAVKKINDAQALIRKIAKQKLTATDVQLPALVHRYQVAETAKKHWISILEEE